MSPLAGALEMEAEFTVAVATLPSTMWSPSLVIAFVPSPRLAATAASRASLIFPPFNPRALAPTLIPSVSLSAACTV